ncbi:MAG: hypothetical protein H0W73_02685 [Bacteroidetes bacterium]|nr:hypothetical protein [Bacteroidota bacterium]
MKKLGKLLLILIVPLFINAKDTDIIKLRDLYYKASTNRAQAEVFFNTISSFSAIDKSLIEGYKGMSFMIKANFDFNPYYKLSYFVKGKGFLDDAITGDPENIELRFLRFCVQTNAPGFLGYSGKITEDKIVIKKYYPTLEDVDLKKRIKDYMINSKSCSKEEKLIFSK